jgi:hypothetical protein
LSTPPDYTHRPRRSLGPRRLPFTGAAKALLDGLTDAGMWADDQQVSFGRVEQFVERGGVERVVVWVREILEGSVSR